jgi:hypothetical protein
LPSYHEPIDDPLLDSTLYVRPPREPVPTALLGTVAGEVYAKRVRMIDGEEHQRRRAAIERFLETIEQVSSVEEMATVVGAADTKLAAALARVAAAGMAAEATDTDAGAAISAVPNLIALLPDDDHLDVANRIGLLVQSCAIETGVSRTRRFTADGTEIVVDLTGRPFGAGVHRCPGERLVRCSS